MPLSTSFNLCENDIYFLVGKGLKSSLGLSQNNCFFEVPVGGSRADMVYVQEPKPYETSLSAGVHIFEVKMRWDSDVARLRKQLMDYLAYADYVWVVGVNCIPKTVFDGVGSMVFSTNGCSVGVISPANHCIERVDSRLRQNLLTELSDNVKRRLKCLREMCFVNQLGGKKILVQKKL